MTKFNLPRVIKQPQIVPYLLAGADAEAFLKEFNYTKS